jgi:Zn-dependent peptidase ImmA (M78 family)
MAKLLKPSGFKQAGRITQMLDKVLGEDRFDRAPVDVTNLALQYSAQTSPESPIRQVTKRDIPGCMGALVYGESKPRQWAIMYHHDQSPGRTAYTIGHEFGHYIMHRKLIDEDDRFDGGIYCDESSVLRREGSDIEQEADEFAANLLMPFHDFRRQISAKSVPNFDDLGKIADRYGVSLTAATLRWLEYTETRALLVVSNEGYAHWAKTSKAALKTGNFIKTRNTMYELPAAAVAVTQDFRQETVDGIQQQAGVWFKEPVVEMCIPSKRYEQELTLLHLPRTEPVFHAEEVDEDVFDRLSEPSRR